MGQVLNGTNPGDIPFDQVTRLELAINLKTAKSLGLEFPATLLGSADLVVERRWPLPKLAHRVVPRQRSNSVAFGVKRTLSRIYEYTP
jgi:hypothetical protein